MLLLKQTLAEEEAADKKLTHLGEGGINEAGWRRVKSEKRWSRYVPTLCILVVHDEPGRDA